MIAFPKLEPGCPLDEFHHAMWKGMVLYLVSDPEVREHFEQATGVRFYVTPTVRDPVTGQSSYAHSGADYLQRFSQGVTPLYWGDDDYLSPMITAALEGPIAP